MSLVCEYKKNQKSGQESGFSLIEVAIAMVVISVLAVPFIQQYNLYKAQKITDESRGNLYVVKSALQKYALNYGRYPIPSDGNKGSGAVGYGEETTTAVVACTVNSSTVCRTTTGSLGGVNVLIGTVPFSTIGLPEEYTLDGYKRRFTYAVTESLTSDTTFQDNKGSIRLNDNTTGFHSDTTNNLQFIVVSHGLNGKGAFTTGGVRPYACTGAGTDVQNCNNDAIFNSNYNDIGTPPEYKRLEFGVTGATYYDDYVEFATSTSSDIWTMNAKATNQDIYNRSKADKVRIGTWDAGPLLTVPPKENPDAKVDVAGNVKANELWTSRLCTFAENATGAASYIGCEDEGSGTPQYKVFTPSIIGGDVDPHDTKPENQGFGINCGEKALKGIQNADEVCSNYTTPVFTVDASCVTGTGGIKFVGGVLYCGTQ